MMTVVIPMWFIYLWAISIVINLINVFRFKKVLRNLGETLAMLLAPKIIDGLKDLIVEKTIVIDKTKEDA